VRGQRVRRGLNRRTTREKGNQREYRGDGEFTFSYSPGPDMKRAFKSYFLINLFAWT
jgi:hypothetical protein